MGPSMNETPRRGPGRPPKIRIAEMSEDKEQAPAAAPVVELKPVRVDRGYWPHYRPDGVPYKVPAGGVVHLPRDEAIDVIERRLGVRADAY